MFVALSTCLALGLTQTSASREENVPQSMWVFFSVPGSAYGFGHSQVLEMFGEHHAVRGLCIICQGWAWLPLPLIAELISFLCRIWRLGALCSPAGTHSNEWPSLVSFQWCCGPAPSQSLREPLAASALGRAQPQRGAELISRLLLKPFCAGQTS